jgi:hypothetical protein
MLRGRYNDQVDIPTMFAISRNPDFGGAGFICADRKLRWAL